MVCLTWEMSQMGFDPNGLVFIVVISIQFTFHWCYLFSYFYYHILILTLWYVSYALTKTCHVEGALKSATDNFFFLLSNSNSISVRPILNIRSGVAISNISWLSWSSSQILFMQRIHPCFEIFTIKRDFTGIMIIWLQVNDCSNILWIIDRNQRTKIVIFQNIVTILLILFIIILSTFPGKMLCSTY